MDIHQEVDARGLNCPLPILKAKKALAQMQSGQVLKVVATDTGSMADFKAFATQTGNELLEQTSEGGEFIHLLRRRSRRPPAAGLCMRPSSGQWIAGQARGQKKPKKKPSEVLGLKGSRNSVSRGSKETTENLHVQCNRGDYRVNPFGCYYPPFLRD